MRRQKPSKRQIKLVRALIKNPSITLAEAARKAGYKESTHMKQDAHRALQNPTLKSLRDLMESDPRLNQTALKNKLAEGLNAKETKFFSHEGQVVETRDVINYDTRHNYLQLAHRLKGDLKISDDEATQVNQLILNLSDSDLALIAIGKATLADFAGRLRDANNSSPSVPSGGEQTEGLRDNPLRSSAGDPQPKGRGRKERPDRLHAKPKRARRSL